MRAFCSLTRRQAALYQQSVTELATDLERAEGMKRRGLVLASLMRLKQICNHPSQWLGDGAWSEADSGKLARLREIACASWRSSGRKGRKISPVAIEGRKIARTFWGEAWCDNLERYSDFANRLPRGRTYVRNGSVVDLQVAPGRVHRAR